MLILKNKLQNAFIAVKTAWDGALKTVKESWRDWADGVNSDTETEYYNWTELLVTIREWIGDRVIGNIQGNEWSVKNRHYEGSFGLKVSDINDEKFGMLPRKTQELLAAARLHPENLLFDAVDGAFAGLCFDGQFFFDTDHPTLDQASTYSNLYTDPFSYDAMLLRSNHMFLMRNAQGNRLVLEPDAILVGSKYIHMARNFFDAEKKPGTMNDPNQLKGQFKPVYCPKFEGSEAEYWVLTFKIPGSNLRAFLYQERTMADIYCTAMNDGGSFGVPGKDAIEFLKDEVYFGTDFWGAATHTLPVLACASTGTGE